MVCGYFLSVFFSWVEQKKDISRNGAYSNFHWLYFSVKVFLSNSSSERGHNLASLRRSCTCLTRGEWHLSIGNVQAPLNKQNSKSWQNCDHKPRSSSVGCTVLYGNVCMFFPPPALDIGWILCSSTGRLER